MQAASAVEALLCRVTTPDRATAMVGDLVEIREQRGAVWFWFSAARVLLTLMWRWPLAFVASFYAGAWVMQAFMWATTGIKATHRPSDYPWGPVFEGICLVGSSAIALSVFAAIRYGLRERATQVVLAWATLAATVIYLWWVPVVLVTCIAGAAPLIFYSVCAREGRWSSVLVWTALVVAIAGFFFWVGVGTLYQHWVKPGPWGSDDMLQHRSAVWLTFGLMLSAHFARIWVWSRMRAWLAWSRRVDARCEML